MGAAVAAVVYVWLAQGAAFLLTPRSIPLAFRLRAFGFWAVSAPIIFVFQNPLATMFILVAVMLVAAPLARDRVAFFLVAAPAVPVFISAPLPFPGINFLTNLTHLKLAALALLLPVFISRNDSGRPGILSGPGLVVLIYVFYTSLMITLPTNITGGMRFFLDQLLLIALPYFAILYALRKTEDIDAFFQAFLIASLILAFVAILSRAKMWDIYARDAIYIMEIREGGMRVNATAGTHSLAFHLAAAFMLLEFLKHRLGIGWIMQNIMRVILVAGMLTTGSRGALGGLIVAWCIYTFLTLRSTPLRASLFFALIAGTIAGSIWLAQGDVDAYDEHGTFSYRQELLWTSVDYIAKYPFFGDRHFLTSGVFDHLLQGQGIIDITNLYLQVALTFGLIGLTLFSGVFVFPALATAFSLLSFRRQHSQATSSAHSASESDTWFRAACVVVSIIAGWLFLVVTTSDVGLTLHLGVVFAALCQCLRRLRPIAQPDPATSSTPGTTGAPNTFAPA